jgi:hypothetical protein
VEADKPWTETQEKALASFIKSNGLSLEERRSRISIFRDFPTLFED